MSARIGPFGLSVYAPESTIDESLSEAPRRGVDVRESFDHREFRPKFGRERVRGVALNRQTAARVRPIERERRDNRRTTQLECLKEVQSISLPVMG